MQRKMSNFFKMFIKYVYRHIKLRLFLGLHKDVKENAPRKTAVRNRAQMLELYFSIINF